MTVWVPFRMHLNSTTPVSQAEQQRRKLGALLVGGNLLLGAVLAGLVLSVMSSSRQAHEDRARAAAERFVAIASASLQSELGAVDTALKITMDDLQRAGFDAGASVQDINDHLAAKHRVLAGVEGFRVADENGLVRWGNLIDSASPPDITNRDFFFRARDSSSDKAVVSDPVISRVSGHSVIVVARPMAWGGKFRGVLYASIHTEHFEQIFKRYELADHDGISLRTNDLKLVALQSPRGRSAAAVGTRDVAQELQDSLRSKPSAGSYLATSKVDGISRTFAYRQVDGWPLLAIAGLDNSNRWSQWRREMLMVSLLAGLAWALSCAATIAVYRFGRREIRAVAALQAQSRQTQTLLRVAGDGIHILDRAGRLVELSDSFAEMHGSSRDKLQGQHVASWDANQNEARIDAWLAKIRDGDRQRVEVQHVRSDGSIIDVDLHWRAVDIDGHLLIFGSARDITDKKRLLQSLEESSARIQDLYDHAPCGYFSLDADGRFVHLNATAKAWLGGDLPSDAKFVGLLDAATRPQFRDHFIALALQLHAPEIEVCISPANAPQRHLCINSAAVRDADGNFLMSRTVAVDITAQREAQQRVESLLREQSAMLNSDVVGMVKFHHGKVSWKNRAFEKMLGYEDGELAGAAIETLCAEDGERHALAQKTLLAMRRGENYRDDVRLKQNRAPRSGGFERCPAVGHRIVLDGGGHHRSQTRARADHPRGLSRRAHPAAQPAVAVGPHATGAGGRGTVRPRSGGVFSRPRWLQGGERPVRARGGGQAARGHCRADIGLHPRDGHCSTAGGRRVRAAARAPGGGRMARDCRPADADRGCAGAAGRGAESDPGHEHRRGAVQRPHPGRGAGCRGG